MEWTKRAMRPRVWAAVRTVVVGLLLVFVLLVLAAAVAQQDLPLFGHGFGGRLAHGALSTHFLLVVAVICANGTRRVTGGIQQSS